MPDNFYSRVYAMVKHIPRGKVASYGQIAALCGSPRAARQVGWALHALDTHNDMQKIPWQRVVNHGGRISTTCPEHGPQEQAALLAAEGIQVTRQDDAYWINLQQYLWHPSA